MIPTAGYSAALTRALARHQRWLDEYGRDAHGHPTRALIDRLTTAPGARRQPLHLRMAKAQLRTSGPT